jgi:hypothetical protein
MDASATYTRGRHASLPGDLPGTGRLREDQMHKAGPWHGMEGFGQGAGKASALAGAAQPPHGAHDDQNGYSQLAGMLSLPHLPRGPTPGADQQATHQHQQQQRGDPDWNIGAARYAASDAAPQQPGSATSAGAGRALPWNYSFFGDHAGQLPPAIQCEWDGDAWPPSTAPASFSYPAGAAAADAAAASRGASPLHPMLLQQQQQPGAPAHAAPDMAQLQAALEAASMGSRMHSPMAGSHANANAFPLPAGLAPLRTANQASSRPMSPVSSFSSPRIESPLAVMGRQPQQQSRLGDVRKQTVNRALDLTRAAGMHGSLDGLARAGLEMSALELGLDRVGAS